MGMVQTYEVFIGDGRIVFAETPENADNSSTILTDPSKEDLLETITELERRNISDAIVSGDIKSNWTAFRNEYHLIEAAGGMVRNANGDWLFIHRNGKWDLAKGKLESFEQPEEAATREVSEECGISEPQLETELIRTYHTYSQHGHRVLKRTYWYLMNHGLNEEPVPQTEEGIDEVRWVRTTDIRQLINDSYPSIIRVVEAALLFSN